MRRLFVALLLLLAAAFACDAGLERIWIGNSVGCNAVADRVYANERFHVCGEVTLNGEILAAGTVSAYEPEMGKSSAQITNGQFSIPMSASITAHKYHYIDLQLERPCEKSLGEAPLEIRTECVMVPPSTIEAVPNVVNRGGRFTLEVKNSPTDVSMKVSGLSSPISSIIPKGGSWSQTFPSESCSPLGSCIIRFEFTDRGHEICKANANVVMTVKEAASNVDGEEPEGAPLALATLFVLVVGTVGAVILNRYI